MINANIQGTGIYKISDTVPQSSSKIIDTFLLTEFNGVEWTVLVKNSTKAEIRKINAVYASTGIKYSAPTMIGDNMNVVLEVLQVSENVYLNLINNESDDAIVSLIRFSF